MLRITLAQMRRSVGRLAAAGVAIVIGTAFVAATLLAGGIITQTTYDSIAARFADADLVVGAADDDLITDTDAIAATDGVAAAAPVTSSFAELASGARTVFQSIVPTADERLMPLEVTKGEMPAADDEIALPGDVADRLGLTVGDTVDANRDLVGQDGAWEQATESLTVVGLLDDPYGAYSQSGGAAVVDADAYAAWEADAGLDAGFAEVGVVLEPDADLAAVQTALAETIGGTTTLDGPPWVVPTDERAAQIAAQFTAGQDLMFLMFVLTFAAIALVVAGLVIANTFQVLVAQRARTLALLRCVGADKAQVGRGVLTEAAILGLLASVAGVLLGTALAQTALWTAQALDVPVPLPATVAITWQVVVIPVLVGTLVTVGAAVVPARVATRVAPLAALRPADSPTASRRAGKVRLVLSLLAAVVGFALLGAGAALGTVGEDPTFGLLAGIAGGALSFIGVAVGAVFWLPKVAATAGRLVGASGPTARLAAANTLRNPRRTATTSTALLIGVTLVAMMSTGASSARTSITAALDETFPVDVMVSSTTWDDDGATALPEDLRADVSAVDGVTAVADVAEVSLETPEFAVADDGTQVPATGSPDEQLNFTGFTAVDAEAVGTVINDPAMVDGLAPGTVLIGSDRASGLGVDDGALELAGPDGTATFDVVVSDAAPFANFITLADLAELDSGRQVSELYLALDDSVDAMSAVGAIQDVVADSGESAQVDGVAVERATFDQVIDTVLAIVVGLLAVAVVIALIGVANTLSLSVLERRRESATLRAIGLSKAQLRGMLAIEGLLIAGVGAVLGVLLGLVYGWAGAAAGLGIMGDVTLSVPWRDMVLVLVVALVAGLVASVAPARTALKASPVEALATE